MIESRNLSTLKTLTTTCQKTPYWNLSSKKITKQLWQPIKGSFHTVNRSTTGSDSFARCLELNEANIANTQHQTFEFVRSKNTDMVQANMRYCKMIRIYPTPEQVTLFNKCIGANRYFYNRANDFVKKQFKIEKQRAIDERDELVSNTEGCVYVYTKGKNTGEFCNAMRCDGSHYCTTHGEHDKLNINYNFLNRQVIRDAVVTPDSLLNDDSWEREIPYDTRQYAIDQLTAVYKSNFELRKNRENKKFDVSFRVKKAGCEVFQIRKESLNLTTQKIFSRRIKNPFRVKKRDKSKLLDGFDGIVTCLKIKPGKWYLALPTSLSTVVPKDEVCYKDMSRKPKPTEPPIYESAAYKSVFIDPGVRAFATFYSPDGTCGKIGNGFAKKYLVDLSLRIEYLESTRARHNNAKTRLHIKNRLFKIRQKMKNIVKDLHNKACNFLCKNFDTIFLPLFKSSEMVLTSTVERRRIINKNSVKQMLELSHCKFREKLIHVAKAKQRKLILVNEEYTTKTCGKCGILNDNVGGLKTFVCSTCTYRMDRDYHGARNLCIKILS